jgi:hypothetical protein
MRGRQFRDTFADLEQYQSRFFAIQDSIHGPPYDWPLPPLYEWSRRVEYPFAVHSLASRPVGRTLDAGSGAAFFPLYLRQEWGVPVECLDYKAAYVDRMNQVGQLFDLKDAIPFHVAERWQGTADPRGT